MSVTGMSLTKMEGGTDEYTSGEVGALLTVVEGCCSEICTGDLLVQGSNAIAKTTVGKISAQNSQFFSDNSVKAVVDSGATECMFCMFCMFPLCCSNLILHIIGIFIE